MEKNEKYLLIFSGVSAVAAILYLFMNKDDEVIEALSPEGLPIPIVNGMPNFNANFQVSGGEGSGNLYILAPTYNSPNYQGLSQQYIPLFGFIAQRSVF